jgi:hypothetical protein
MSQILYPNPSGGPFDAPFTQSVDDILQTLNTFQIGYFNPSNDVFCGVGSITECSTEWLHVAPDVTAFTTNVFAGPPQPKPPPIVETTPEPHLLALLVAVLVITILFRKTRWFFL